MIWSSLASFCVLACLVQAGSQAATVPSVGLDRSVAGGSGVGLSVSVTAESGPTPLATAPHTAEDRKTLR